MNRLKGYITSIQSSLHLSFVGVETNGELLHLLLLEKPLEAIGDEVNLVFKESEVILSKDVIKSTANMSKGIIGEIQKGEILTHVTLLHNDIEIASFVPTQTFDMMKCNLGDTIYWIISLVKYHFKGVTMENDFMQTMVLTFELATITTIVLLFIGIPIASFLVFTKTKFKSVIETIVSMPLVLPPSVLGFYLLLAFSPASFMGEFLTSHGIRLAFSFEGLIIALYFLVCHLWFIRFNPHYPKFQPLFLKLLTLWANQTYYYVTCSASYYSSWANLWNCSCFCPYSWRVWGYFNDWWKYPRRNTCSFDCNI